MMLQYELGEMRDKDGSALRYRVEADASKYAIQITERLMQSRIYKQLAEKMPSTRLPLYFRYRVRDDIYGFVLQACVIDWYAQGGGLPSAYDIFVDMPDCGIFRELKEKWAFESARVRLVSPVLFHLKNYYLIISRIRKVAKKVSAGVIDIFCLNRSSSAINKISGGVIACHYAEGVEPAMRNDLNWYNGSGVSPDRVLIYFDSRHSAPHHDNSKGLIKEEVIAGLEARGFKCVTLEKGLTEGSVNRFWCPSYRTNNMRIGTGNHTDPIDKWLVRSGRELADLVRYWRAFYDHFNVKVNYVAEEGSVINIAQSIAFDIAKERGSGILAGKQRSEAYFPPGMIINHHPKHVYFTWNNRSHLYSGTGSDKVDQFVVTGYPYGALSEKNPEDAERVHAMKRNGAEFIVAICDNVCGPGLQFSCKQMTDFYEAFLRLALADSSLGLVVKSKKPFIINGLVSVKPLLGKLISAGRCVKLDQVSESLPLASVDIVIGIGISSITTEAVIHGSRGIHYDISRVKGHDYFKWGYGRLVFDDLGVMMDRLNAFRRGSDTRLGDWSDVIDRLDPFRDGKGGQRMGEYIRSLLEAFDRNMGYRSSIEYANLAYADRWGGGKIINTGGVNGSN